MVIISDMKNEIKYPGFAKRFCLAVDKSGVDDSQLALSKLLSVSGPMVWAYKNGEKLPRMEKAAHIAGKLKVSLAWLMDNPFSEEVELSASTNEIQHMFDNIPPEDQKIAEQMIRRAYENRKQSE